MRTSGQLLRNIGQASELDEEDPRPTTVRGRARAAARKQERDPASWRAGQTVTKCRVSLVPMRDRDGLGIDHREPAKSEGDEFARSHKFGDSCRVEKLSSGRREISPRCRREMENNCRTDATGRSSKNRRSANCSSGTEEKREEETEEEQMVRKATRAEFVLRPMRVDE